MPEDWQRQSPLAARGLAARAAASGAGEAALVLGERRFLGKVDLRADLADPATRAAVDRALGFAVPRAPNTVRSGDRARALWLGPDEWLIVSPPDAADAMLHGLRRALRGRRAAVTDVSDGRTVVALEGARARDLLAKGCPLDLHPRSFGVDCCAQTLLAKAPVLLHRSAAHAFEVYVDASYAEYLWAWCEDAASEFGFAVLA